MKASPALACALALVACKPDLGPNDSLVTSTRILAVKSEPAEAPPGTTLTLTAFVASPNGTLTTSPVAWSFCTAPKPLTTDNIVSDACLTPGSLVPVGNGAGVYATTPGNACELFGPDVPPGGFRPRDPDETGGYYQPARADLAGADTAFDLLRVTCELANAPEAIATEFTKEYVPNANPHIASLSGIVNGAALSQTSVPAGARVAITVGWSASDAETYAYFDPATQALTTQRESMRVSWYVSGGGFDTESTGRAATDLVTSTSDTWTTPTTPGTVHLWLVLRDSRGGVDYAGYDFTIVSTP